MGRNDGWRREERGVNVATAEKCRTLFELRHSGSIREHPLTSMVGPGAARAALPGLKCSQ